MSATNKMMFLLWWQVLNILTLLVTSEPEPMALLTDLNNGHNLEGKTITLECRTTFYLNHVSIGWEKPKDVVANITAGNSTNSSYPTLSTLVIQKTDDSSSGIYWCEIVHKKVNYRVKSNVLEITVYDGQTSDIQVPGERNFFDQSNAEIKIPFKAHPKASEIGIFKIIDDTKKWPTVLVSPFNEGKYNYLAKVSFENITQEDLGRYYIKVDTLKFNFEVKFDDIVPKSLRIISSNEEDMSVVYQCKATGHTKPYITWRFLPCENLDCLIVGREMASNKLFLNESKHEDRGLQVISYVSLDLKQTGILRCMISNELGYSTPMFYIYNGFDVFIDSRDNIIYNSTKKIRGHVGFAQEVYLMCGLSIDKYTPHIQWYHGKKSVDKDDMFFYQKNRTYSDKIAHYLWFTYINEDDLGNYSCQSLKKTGETELRTVEFFSKNMSMMNPQVTVEDLRNGHTTVKDDISLLCTVSFYKYVNVNWTFAEALKNNRETQKSHKKVGNVYITSSYLKIPQAEARQGYYKCQFVDPNIVVEDSKYVWIYDMNYTIITFSPESKFDLKDKKIEILVRAHPHPEIKWYDNHKNEISPKASNTSNLYFYSETLQRGKWNENYRATLYFNNIDSKDFGSYTIHVKNKYTEKSLSVLVNVTGVPTTRIDIDTNTSNNITLRCTSIGNPKPRVEWYFKNCTTLKSCFDLFNKSRKGFIHRNPSWNVDKGLQQISYISIDLSERGILSCRSLNIFGENYSHEPILGSGPELEIFTENVTDIQRLEIVAPHRFTIICAIPHDKYTGEYRLWFHYESVISRYSDSDLLDIVEGDSEHHYLFSTFVTFEIFIDKSVNYVLTFSALKKDGFLKSRRLHIDSRLSRSATIYKTNMLNRSVQVTVGSNCEFYCHVKGFPSSYIKWFKNGEDVSYSDRFKFLDNREILKIEFVTSEDEGVYTCQLAYKYFAKNTENIKHSCELYVVMNHGWLYAQIILIFCVFILIGSIFLIIFLKEKQLKRELRFLGLVYFERGDMENINPILGIESQAHLLPYDSKWEIPFDKIKIGKQLGSGAFGTTFQAIIDNQTVAVKTVNRHTNFECMKVLVSELKIMSHLGKHINIVNLLGACTKHVVKRELYIILEFCVFGNILDHIKRCSVSFIDQKDYEIDEFNWVSGEENRVCVENKSFERISSKDFLIWSFQIARGMDYLGSRKIVHGDLAARNVLLSENNLVKLCDFGLSKHMYNYDNYVKKEKGPLPIKWMSIEAIEKGIFSTQSDVWSFGIVLWEIFSLGKVPYPGVTIDENFCQKLSDGYRMESPVTATTKIYEIMLHCWNLDPLKRPYFQNLCVEIGNFLEEPLREHYVSMNKGYMIMNKQQFEQEDYLTMIKAPTYENIIRQ